MLRHAIWNPGTLSLLLHRLQLRLRLRPRRIHLDRYHPAGHNLVVALMPFYGYNIEDAIIVNKASLDRGLGRSFFFRTYNTEARRYWGGQEDEIGLPEASIRGFKSDEEYADLGPEGIVMPETFVGGNGVLVGKTSPLRFLSSQNLSNSVLYFSFPRYCSANESKE